MGEKKSNINWNLKDILSFFISKKFWINLGFILLLLIILFFILKEGLRIYTHHGQKLRMPDYINSPLKTAREDAEDRTFKIVVTDSVFIVGKPGNIILSQNPNPNVYVKENRTIYVTVTKSRAEKVRVKDLPRLYGEKFSLKAKELKIGYKIESEVIGKAYDPGPEDHILAVLYYGDTIVTSTHRKGNVEIEKGSKLQFILSKQTGGLVSIPNLRCRRFAEAKFLLSSFGLYIHISEESEDVPDLNQAFVKFQQPLYDPAGKIRMGDTIQVTLSPTIPVNCGN